MKLLVLSCLLMTLQAFHSYAQTSAIQCDAFGMTDGYTIFPNRIADDAALVKQFWQIDSAIHKRCPGIKKADLEIRIFCPDSSGTNMSDVFILGVNEILANSKGYMMRMDFISPEHQPVVIQDQKELYPVNNWSFIIQEKLLPIVKNASRKNPFSYGPRINQPVFLVYIRCYTSAYLLLDFWDDLENNILVRSTTGNILADMLRLISEEMKIGNENN